MTVKFVDWCMTVKFVNWCMTVKFVIWCMTVKFVDWCMTVKFVNWCMTVKFVDWNKIAMIIKIKGRWIDRLNCYLKTRCTISHAFCSSTPKRLSLKTVQVSLTDQISVLRSGRMSIMKALRFIGLAKEKTWQLCMIYVKTASYFHKKYHLSVLHMKLIMCPVAA